MNKIYNSILILFIGFTFFFMSATSVVAGPDRTNKEISTDDAEFHEYIIYTEEKRIPGNYLLPLNYIFNSSFDSAQVPTAFKQAGYFKNFKKVFDNIVHLPRSIKAGGGWGKFFKDEWTSTRAIPNYTLHIVGGGYDFRLLAEWYKFNNVPAPYFFSFINCYIGHFSNEALEITNKSLTPHDMLADLLFFDWIGKLLYINNDIARFFHNTLQLRDWMGQPMFDVRKTRIYNAACNYVLIPYIYRNMVRFFFLMGYHYLAGAGFRVSETDFITLSAGLAVIGGFNPDKDSFQTTVKKFRPSGGIFYDRNGNLLASLILNGTENFRIRLNVYPGLLNVDRVNFGLFLGLDDYNRVSIGFTIYSLIGLSATL
jgi:hypothetical protein